MSDATAQDPVGRLLIVGRIDCSKEIEWPDYRARFGIGPEHAGALIAMATDLALHEGDAKSAAVWAPVHAWRALAQLRIAEAIGPLLALLRQLEWDDMAAVELPTVFRMIGPAAIPLIADFLADPALPASPAGTAMNGLVELSRAHPECRETCIEILVRLLAPEVQANRESCGYAVAYLLDLHAVETIDAIREAFRRDAIDPTIAGDLEDVEIDLGLRDRRVTPRPRYLSFPLERPTAPPPVAAPVRQPKIGRNDPCPCGSGKKYKKCCLP